MSSRKQAQGRSKRYQKQKPGYVREFAYHEDGSPVLDPETKEHVFRDRPNRALTRKYAAKLIKERDFKEKA